MYFVLQTPSLKHLAQVKIAAVMWNQRDILTQIVHSFHCQRCDDLNRGCEKWKEIEEKVKANVQTLPIPQPSKMELLNVIEPMGTEIINWFRHHGGNENNYQFLDISIPNQLYWTMHGNIDYQKTGELMAKDVRVDVDKRYKLACIDCLEQEARELFTRLSEERRHEYINTSRSVTSIENLDLIDYFTLLINGDQFPSDESSIKKWLFVNTLHSGNRAMGEYSLTKLNQQEKDQVFEERKYKRLVGHCTQTPTCSLLWFLPLLNEEQRRGVFQWGIYDVLVRLLRWPMQSLFMETARCWWECMDTYAFVNVLSAITGNIVYGYRDFNYAQLFWGCWRLSSTEHKQCYFQQGNGLEWLLESKREEFIQLILNEAPSQQLENLFNEMSLVLMDESVISEAALMTCKEKAALESSNNEDDEELRLRSELVNRLVELVINRRMLDELFTI